MVLSQPWVVSSILLNTWRRTPTDFQLSVQLFPLQYSVLQILATSVSPDFYVSSAQRICYGLLGFLLPVLHSGNPHKAVSLDNWRAYLVCFPISQELFFIAWNGWITIVSYILSDFLWSICLFVVSGRRINLVPVAPSWLEAKSFFNLKLFLILCCN